MAKRLYQKTCAVCDGVQFRHGFCSKHYQRWRKYGDPLITLRTPTGDPMRFIREVVLTWQSDECLLWPFGLHGHDENDGYGVATYRGKRWRAHRLVCQLVKGKPRQPELQAAHSCGNRLCVNPKHLRWDTQEGNWADRYVHGTHNRGQLQGLSKLKDDDVREIRKVWSRLMNRQVAKYGVSRDTISAMLNGKSWSWLK